MKSYVKKSLEPIRAVQWLGGAESAAALLDQFGSRLRYETEPCERLVLTNDSRFLIPGDWLVLVPGEPLTSFSSGDFHDLFEELTPAPTEIITSGLERVRKAHPQDSYDEYLCTGCKQWRRFLSGDGEHIFCDDCWAFWQAVGNRVALSTARPT